MLIKSKYIYGMTVEATDGLAGRVVGLLCDSASWVIRYLVIQDRNLIERKRHLVSVVNIHQIDQEQKILRVDLSLQQLEEGPILESNKYVGVEVTKNFFDLKGWPYFEKMYQSGWITGPFNIVWKSKLQTDSSLHLETDSLMSLMQLLGMSIQCKDRNFGVIKNLMIDLENWRCKFIEIRKVKWLPSDFTVIPVEIIQKIDWDKRHIVVDAFEYQVLEAPYYNSRIFSTLSERLFLNYYKIQTHSMETENGELHETKSIA